MCASGTQFGASYTADFALLFAWKHLVFGELCGRAWVSAGKVVYSVARPSQVRIAARGLSMCLRSCEKVCVKRWAFPGHVGCSRGRFARRAGLQEDCRALLADLASVFRWLALAEPQLLIVLFG